MLKLSNSLTATRRAQNVMPGGNTRSSAYEEPHPIYLASGDGAFVTDVDGNRYLDFQNNFTALIHGYNHPATTTAVTAQIAQGLSFANPTISEIALAEILCQRVPRFEQVRFMNTGSEAVMMAVKAARALTGRSMIAKCEGAYHGNYDFVEMSVEHAPVAWEGAPHTGVPSHRGVAGGACADVIVISFNDIEATRTALDQVGGKLAAILFDPMPSRAGLIPIDRAYLELLRAYSTMHGSVLISDEVLSFRLGYAGALAPDMPQPDLCAFGKVIGGGLPIGAVAGSSEFMRAFDPSRGVPPVSHAGTFTANPVSMTAGAAALNAMTPDAFEDLNMLGEGARAALRHVLSDLGITGTVTGAGSLFRIFLGRSEVSGYADAYGTAEQRENLAQVVDEMRLRGVLISRIGLGALSTPMTDEHIDRLQSAFADALQAVRDRRG